jgi:hypothetical protein
MVEAIFDGEITPSYEAKNKHLHVVYKQNYLEEDYSVEEEVWQKELTKPKHGMGKHTIIHKNMDMMWHMRTLVIYNLYPQNKFINPVNDFLS